MHAEARVQSDTADRSLLKSLRRPFLEALRYIDYGTILLHTPEGEVLRFAGPEKGPEAVLQLHDWKVLDDLTNYGETGFAQAYIDRRCDSTDLPALITFALMNGNRLQQFFYGRPWYAFVSYLRGLLMSNSLRGSKRNIMAHYDLGNDFYALWLDKSMTYSGALFEGLPERTLEEAQIQKYHRILRTIAAKPGDHILDIGCGWGAFAEIAAQHGMQVTGVTISEEQAAYGRKRLRDAGLEQKASIEIVDYRRITGKFDHVVSIGMFEHVGEKYWPVYFSTVHDRLKPGGSALVQSITLDDYLFESFHNNSGFIEQVIFPGGMLPSRSRFQAAVVAAGLACRDIYTFGQDYARTAREWLARFEAHKPEVQKLGYDNDFLRLWRFYLSCCIASFTSRRTDVMQAHLAHAS